MSKVGPILNQPISIEKNFEYGMQTPHYEMLNRGNTIPPGLEYLATLDHIFIKQELEVLKIITGCETKNRYKIKNAQGEVLFKAKEDTDCCTRNVCGSIRPFDMHIKDHQGQTLIHLYRPLNCGSYCCPCCLQEVFSPPGVLVGSIEQKWSYSPKFEVKDASGQVVLKINGSLCTCSCTCSDVPFKVLSADGNIEVGQIAKKWSGFLKEAFTDADNFEVIFPADMTIQTKATLIGTSFLIDFMFFQKTN